MGPPELPGGNLPWWAVGTWSGLASMGPPELPGGNGAMHQAGVEPATRLQWGRRNYPAETCGNRRGSVCLPVASMGPPELPGGNTARPKSSARPGLLLQWGRRNYPAETLKRRVSTPTSTACFNGAAGITRRKHVLGGVPCLRQHVASMGPPELPGGNAASAWRCSESTAKASMGPPELPGGNPSMSASKRSAAELQWGRRNYPAETETSRTTRQPG